MNKLLTIVIPVYKVEAYIRKCLDSLIIDTGLMSLLDVLIVNDGTPDSSAEISRSYVQSFPGIFRQIDKENGGHGSVWNLGVKEAYGKYIKFLDSDDWLENLDVLMQKLLQTDADLIITPTITHNPGNELWTLEIKDMDFDKVYDADSFDWLGNHSHGNYIFHHCAIYKTSMFRKYYPFFLEKQPYDDVILGAVPIIGADSLVAWNIPVYHYLMDRPGQSISPEACKRNIAAKIKVHQSRIDFIESHPISDHTSTKYLYFKNKLPKYYKYGYKDLFEIDYSAAVKPYIDQWDSWVKSKNKRLCSIWTILYRLLPFELYVAFWKLYCSLVENEFGRHVQV